MEKNTTEPTLDFTLNTEDAIKAWDALESPIKERLIPHLNTLKSKSILDDGAAMLIMNNRFYASWLTNLLLQLHSMQRPLSDHLDAIAPRAHVAKKLEFILKKLVGLGCVMDNKLTNSVLSIKDVDAFDSLIDFWLQMKMFDQKSLSCFFDKKIAHIDSYVNCLKLLFKWHLNSDSVIEQLDNIAEPNLRTVDYCLHSLDTGGVLSQELWAALIAHQDNSLQINEGLTLLNTCMDSALKPEHALTVIKAAEAAKAVAGSLAFLIKAGLDSSDLCEELLRTKAYSKAIEIVLFQLTRQHGATHENIKYMFQVAPMLIDPIIMSKLQSIPFFSPIPTKQFNELFKQLLLLSPDAPEGERKEALLYCANILNLADKPGGGSLGERAPQSLFPSP